MNKTFLSVVVLLGAIIGTTLPSLSNGQQAEEITSSPNRTINDMIVAYQEKRLVQEREYSPESEKLRLQSQVIDLKVENDRLETQIEYLKHQLNKDRQLVSEVQVCATETNCMPTEQVEQEKIVTHIVYSLSLYRLAEYIDLSLPKDAKYVEAHTTAQRIMQSAMGDLNLLGFDTADPNHFPSLAELISALENSHEAHR